MASCTLWSTTPPFRPKGKKGERLGTLDSSQDLWRQVFEVNLFSTIWLAQGLKNELAKAHGAIVNVTSIAGSRVHPFAGAAYSISKAALAALTREMAADFGPIGVRVNAIAPGEIDTAILSPGTEKIVETIPLRRLGDARGSRQGDLLSVYGSEFLCHRRGTDDQWRTARLTLPLFFFFFYPAILCGASSGFIALQNSEVLSFAAWAAAAARCPGYNMNADDTYIFTLAAFDNAGALLGSDTINVVAGQGAAVPEPVTLSLFGAGFDTGWRHPCAGAQRPGGA